MLRRSNAPTAKSPFRLSPRGSFHHAIKAIKAKRPQKSRSVKKTGYIFVSCKIC